MGLSGGAVTLESVGVFVAIFLLAAVVVACGDDEDEPRPAPVGDPGIVHVHGLGRNPADGSLMVATHTGLFRAGAEGEEPERVADRFQDTMGFTVVGPDHFLGSGHPASVREDPAFLGLIESRDAGSTWRPISLRGEVDFHVLEAQGDVVYGFGSDFETREPRFLASGDGGRSWEQRSPPEPLTGLAIDPGDSRRIVGLGEERAYVSRDGGSTWRPIGLFGGLITWTPEAGLVAAGFDGVIRKAEDPMGDWEETGQLDGSPAALEGVRDELLVATHDARVLSSRDGGSSWREVLRP
jgi:hypothetical protein